MAPLDDDQKWLDDVIQELGLNDTVPSEGVEAADEDMTFLEMITTITVTPEGWIKIHEALHEGFNNADKTRFKAVLDEPDLFRILLGTAKTPYILAGAQGYSIDACVGLAAQTLRALVTFFQKGYDIGRQSMEGPRAQGSEGPGDSSQPE